MNITIIVEGKTEKAFKKKLLEFLSLHIKNMPRIKFHTCNGRVYKEGKLKQVVRNILSRDADDVIALTDVYTGTSDFIDAEDAKSKMREWVGENSRFYPHAAQYEFEAWLLPHWNEILKKAGHKKKAPQGKPETINHGKPPSSYIQEVFRAGETGRRHV